MVYYTDLISCPAYSTLFRCIRYREHTTCYTSQLGWEKKKERLKHVISAAVSFFFSFIFPLFFFFFLATIGNKSWGFLPFQEKSSVCVCVFPKVWPSFNFATVNKTCRRGVLKHQVNSYYHALQSAPKQQQFQTGKQ